MKRDSKAKEKSYSPLTTLPNNAVSSAPQTQLIWLRDFRFLANEFILYFGCFHYIYNDLIYEDMFIEMFIIFLF